ncbi:YaaA family protein [Naasia lichenicola]|uniref:Peroxide stress protein YaaA n=1 Tax=Naasia lichenicola TaxID=2565933 RepID=A0A4S4FPJ2_9MICO|nr:peroxide stress protein YaaA [Naasia lichenicola]THG31485.1 peroxide stress protein YaaA [Naasia lichenicola]
MLILLPPSETKRDGGEGPSLDYSALSFPRLNARRRPLVRAVRTMSRNADEARRALKLGPNGDPDIARNRMISRSSTMPAIDRYTGVIYDALDAPTLSEAARTRASTHLLVHSALFGLVGALDPIPAYRLSQDSRLPELRLGEHWRGPVARELAAREGLIIDLRSEGYAELGPLPVRADAVYVRVLSRGEGGAVRALNHFNKKAKGAFTRALLEAPVVPESTDELLGWAGGADIELRRGTGNELELIV